MICEHYARKFCCEDISLIENYALAIADTTQTWICHHILGEQHSRQYLIDNNLYENRPACELRFMTRAEHNALHKQGVPRSEATKQAISDAQKGVPRPYLKGVPLSEEHKLKLSKKILQYTKSGEFIKEWVSAIEAARELGIARSNICKCCKGERKSAGGYVWRYAS